MGRLLQILKLVAVVTFVAVGLLLAAVSLPFTGIKAMSVQTASMKPAINPGALVFVKSTPAAGLQKGNVITYRSLTQQGVTVTHRITDIKQPSDGPVQYIVRGDANKSVDAPVYKDQIVGKVAFSLPFLGKIVDTVKTPLGLVLFVYLPAALIAISEIRLLVRRLTKIELDKQKPSAATATTGPALTPQLATAPSVMAYEEQAQPKPPAQAPVRRRRRRIDGLSVLVVLVLAIVTVSGTLAQLTATATLTGSTIAAATGPVPVDHVLIKRVDFPGAPQDKVSFQPIVYLYNPMKGNIIDMEGWTLESKSGQVFGFRGATPIFPKTQFDVHPGPSGLVLISGDYLLLKNEVGQVVDAISWGTDTSQFSPAIQGIVARKHVKRLNTTVDTNTAADWQVKP